MKTPYTLITVQHLTLEAGLTGNPMKFQFWVTETNKDKLLSLIEEGKNKTIEKFKKDRSYWAEIFRNYSSNSFITKEQISDHLSLETAEGYPLEFLQWASKIQRLSSNNNLEKRSSFDLIKMIEGYSTIIIIIENKA